jgi:hypothetical protein
LPTAIANAIAGTIHSLSLVGNVDLQGNVTLNAPGFAAEMGRLIAKGIARALAPGCRAAVRGHPNWAGSDRPDAS